MLFYKPDIYFIFERKVFFMSDELLYAIDLEDPSGEFEPASELLNALEVEFSSFFDRENGTVRHTVYAVTEEGAKENLEKLTAALSQWQEFGVVLNMGSPFTIAKSEWAEAWKKYFKPVAISEKLLIRPSWLDDEPLPGQKVLNINPGMSFGTGQHATTFYCLKVIDRLAGEAGISSMLDAGCGSGILAIAGSLCGFDPIDAFDFDPDAVMITKENMELNKVANFTPVTADAADYQGRPEKYDLVCANILAHLLKSFRTNIASWVKEGGYLALAGILEEEFDSVVASYESLGFELIEAETLKEWRSGLFRKN